MFSQKRIWLRKISQAFFMWILIFTPISQVIRVYRQEPFPYRESILAGNFFNQLLTQVDKPLRQILSWFYDDVNGGPYTLKVYWFHFTEPFSAALAMIRNALNPEYFHWILATSFLLPLLVAFLFGRIYCGYICPMSFLTSLNLKIRKRLHKEEPKYSASAIPPFSLKQKIYFFILFTFLFLNPLWIMYLLPPAMLQHFASDFILYGGFSLWGFSFLCVLVLEIVKPAFFCRKLCPTGLFLTLLGKKRVFALVHVPHVRCEKGCHLCQEVCWLGLNPKIREKDAACDLCERCVMVCPQKRLKVGKTKGT